MIKWTIMCGRYKVNINYSWTFSNQALSRDNVSLRSSCCTGTHSVEQAGLKVCHHSSAIFNSSNELNNKHLPKTGLGHLTSFLFICLFFEIKHKIMQTGSGKPALYTTSLYPKPSLHYHEAMLVWESLLHILIIVFNEWVRARYGSSFLWPGAQEAGGQSVLNSDTLSQKRKQTLRVLQSSQGPS